MGRKTEFKRVCLKLLHLYSIQARHQAKSENENDEELDEIPKLSANESKFHRKNILKCSASLCLVLQFDSAPEWVQCSPCDSCVYLMCDLDFQHIKHMLSYECLNCQSYSAQDICKHVDHQYSICQCKITLWMWKFPISLSFVKSTVRTRKISWKMVKKNF